MKTRSPFSLLGEFAQRLPQPPQWLVQSVQHRLVLLLNHVLLQEPLAMQRLTSQTGRVVHTQWRGFHMSLLITPAGLFDLAPPAAAPDLRIAVLEHSPWTLAQQALQGDKPTIHIEGNVALASEMHWLIENVRWDLEEDVARIIGDMPAHALASAVRRGAQALRGFVGNRTPGRQSTPPATP